MKIIAMIFISVILLSCNNDPFIPSGVIARQYFDVRDLEGNNLLESNNNKIDILSIKIYNLINGVEYINSTLYQNSHYSPDITYGFGILKNPINTYLMYIDLNTTLSKDNYSYTIIQWEIDQRDTIKSKVDTKWDIEVEMISYNDSVWSPASPSDVFTIIK